jgi:pimeloyl-ACP methyl ester carboxylesterase
MRAALSAFWVAAIFVIGGCSPQRLDSFLYDPLPEPPGGYQLSTAVIPARSPADDLMVPSTGGALIHVAFVPSSGAHADTTILYFHGQGNNVGSSWSRAELLYPLGTNLAVIDPRGYGRSTGSPSESGIHDDVQAVWDHLVAARGLDPTKFIIYGRSLGAAFATDLAAVRTPAALVTESAFASIAAMVRDGAYVDLPSEFVADSRWDNLAKIARMPAPYLAMHGLADDYVRYQYSQQLAAAHAAAQASETKLVLVPGSGHGDANSPAVALQDDYLPLLSDFLRL